MNSLRSSVSIIKAVLICLVFLCHQTLVLRVRAFDVVHRISYQRRAILSAPFVDCPIRATYDTSSLRMKGEGGELEPSQGKATVNIPLVLQNLANQALIGCTIWSGGLGYNILTEEAHLGPGAIVFGIIGVIPMLALSRKIETSESVFVAGLNLSTNMAVLRLFGATPQPLLALLISIFVALSTGIVEETIFRGQALPAFASAYGNGDVFIGILLSTLLFAFLHTNPLSFFKGGEAFSDNLVLLILQIINGATFALLYVVTGNLAVPIITHTLYDFYTFYKTHMVDVAGQMQYAEKEALMPICSSNAIEQKWIIERGEDWLRGAKQSFFLMDTNRDGKLSRKELRISLYSYGINLSKDQSQQIKQAVDIDESGSIDFDEYLEYIGPAGNNYKAVRNTLLGPT
mmetsp:Transcript_10082/g.10803  ORF Transcript_10082/g.10803 Transcript_10082/m.10803 type:complete len:402 (+) Transcript_10082:72-1277(+)